MLVGNGKFGLGRPVLGRFVPDCRNVLAMELKTGTENHNLL